MVLFGGIASILLIAVISLISRGTKFVELGRRTSGAQTDLRTVLELMAEDVGEMVQLEGTGGEMDAAAGFSFLIKSSRAEKGIDAGKPSLRKIEYKFDGAGPLKDVVRTVTVQGGPGGGGSERLVRAGVTKLKAFPIAAVPKASSFVLKPANDGQARQPGATPVCLVIEISAGQALPGATVQLEQDQVSTIVTKLWCRNRVMELARGALR